MRTLLFRILFELTRALRPRPRSAPPRKVLVLQYAMPLGCCVHSTPLFAALKSRHPDMEIAVASRSLGADTLRHNHHVDFLIETQDPMASHWGLWPVIRDIRSQLRARSFAPDLVLQDASSRRGTYALLPAFLALAPSAGFADAPALYDYYLAYDSALSLIDNNLRLTLVAGEQAAHTEPEVYFTARELAHARALLATANPDGLAVTAFVVQGSGGQRTGWHDRHFATVLGDIASLGHVAVFLGTSADAAAVERIRRGQKAPGVSLAGQTTIPELAALLCLVDLVITLDTGTMHVGRSTGVPMVVLGPSWQRPLEWLPVAQEQVAILRGEDRAAAEPDYKLDEIEPGQVTAAASRLLEAFPPSPESREDRVRRRLSAVRA